MNLRSLFVAAALVSPSLAAAVPSVVGGADRGDATVSGNLVQTATGASGRWMMVLRPTVPDSDILAAVCSYRIFYNFSVVGNVVSFDARGSCTYLDEGGALPTVQVANHFTITDLGAGPDIIDVNTYGPGPAVPGGFVSFGDFTVTP